MHLTNYAINKNNDCFEAAEDTDGAKMGLVLDQPGSG